MTGISDEAQKFLQLSERVQKASDQKIRLEERFKTEKERLEKLLKEIADKGYDPKNLTEIRKTKETELIKMLEKLESDIKETEQKLNAIEVG